VSMLASEGLTTLIHAPKGCREETVRVLLDAPGVEVAIAHEKGCDAKAQATEQSNRASKESQFITILDLERDNAKVRELQ
jgi:hypothetical protein